MEQRADHSHSLSLSASLKINFKKSQKKKNAFGLFHRNTESWKTGAFISFNILDENDFQPRLLIPDQTIYVKIEKRYSQTQKSLLYLFSEKAFVGL